MYLILSPSSYYVTYCRNNNAELPIFGLFKSCPTDDKLLYIIFVTYPSGRIFNSPRLISRSHVELWYDKPSEKYKNIEDLIADYPEVMM